MGKLIDGKLIAEKIIEKTAKEVVLLKKEGKNPKLAVVLVGRDKPSETYVENKKQIAEKIGINFELHKSEEDISEEELIEKIIEIQKDSQLSGIIVQLPIPNHINTKTILNTVRPELDVDYLTDANYKKLEENTNDILPPTPGAIVEIIKELNVNLSNKNVVIIGKGILVGKPLAVIMKNMGANVVICDSQTTDVQEKCLKADIIITGVGKKDILRGCMVKNGAIVIDAGTSFENEKMYGDVNVAEVLDIASYVTPTPGGVGPITVAMLLWNTVVCAQK